MKVLIADQFEQAGIDGITAAGCEVIYPLADQFYGDRGGRLRDPFGHQWMLSTHVEDVDRDELDRRMQEWSAG